MLQTCRPGTPEEGSISGTNLEVPDISGTPGGEVSEVFSDCDTVAKLSVGIIIQRIFYANLPRDAVEVVRLARATGRRRDLADTEH